VLIEQVADAARVRASFVEKDFWAIEVLRAAQTTRAIPLKDDAGVGEVTMLFKGGTSLSRAFGLVQRFSEDVDFLAVFPANTSPAARHKALKQVDPRQTHQAAWTTQASPRDRAARSSTRCSAAPQSSHSPGPVTHASVTSDRASRTREADHDGRRTILLR
jgi:hypothetical protein